MSHFATVLESAGANPANMLDEWTALKSGIYSQPGWLQYVQCTTWAELNRKYVKELPNIFKLVDLVLSLPASTAECERGFNSMKQIKSDWRSALGRDALNDLMTVILTSSDINEFDPKDAIEM